MSIEPMTEGEIWDEINRDLSEMTAAQTRLWAAIQIIPERWKQLPYGTYTSGFWAVALFGRSVVWYNEIEGGFNISSYSQHGTINEYWCNQDRLQWTLQGILNSLEHGYPLGPFAGPPQPGASQ